MHPKINSILHTTVEKAPIKLSEKHNYAQTGIQRTIEYINVMAKIL